jgi:hypothetical protein
MFIHMGSIQRNNMVFLLDRSAVEIIYAAGYPINKHNAVEIAARKIESHNILVYSGLKNFLKLSKVNCMVVISFEFLDVMLYRSTSRKGSTMNITIHTM